MPRASIKQAKRRFITKLGVGLIIIGIGGSVVGYLIGINIDASEVHEQNTPGYITAESARSHVDNFYQQYLHPKKESPEESRDVYVSEYGSKNLVFYKAYYQHGFDPIVCSTVMPTSVAVTDIQPGAGANVVAEAEYPNGSTANIGLTLVINAEGFKIDSITCPGDKGNLLPAKV